MSRSTASPLYFKISGTALLELSSMRPAELIMSLALNYEREPLKKSSVNKESHLPVFSANLKRKVVCP